MTEYHSRAVSKGMKRVWARRGAICPKCGRKYLRPSKNTTSNGMYEAIRSNWDMCWRCDPTHLPSY